MYTRASGEAYGEFIFFNNTGPADFCEMERKDFEV